MPPRASNASTALQSEAVQRRPSAAATPADPTTTDVPSSSSANSNSNNNNNNTSSSSVDYPVPLQPPLPVPPRAAGPAARKRPSQAERERKSLLDTKEARLDSERRRRRDDAELREACVGIRSVAEALRSVLPYEVGRRDLQGWAAALLTQVSAVEGRIAQLVGLPTVPPNTADAASPPPAHDRLLDPRAGGPRRRVSAQAGGDAPRPPATIVAGAGAGAPAAGSPQASAAAQQLDGGAEASGHCRGTSVNGGVAAALYLVLEAAAERVRAERGVAFLHTRRSDELQAFCIVNGGSGAGAGGKPSTLKVSSTQGWPGQVFSTGVAANVTNVYSDSTYDTSLDKKFGYRTRSILCVPIPFAEGRSSVGQKCFGVLQVVNKNRGTADFTAEDEATLSHVASVVAYLAQHYPADVAHSHYDTAPLHKLLAFRPLPPQHMAIPIHSRSKRLVYRYAQSGHYKPLLPAVPSAAAAPGDVAAAPPAVSAASSDPALAAALRAGAPPPSVLDLQAGITEVDGHIRALEDAWLRTVSLNVEYQEEQANSLRVVRALREALRERKLTISLQQKQLAECYVELSSLKSPVNKDHSSASAASGPAAAAAAAAAAQQAAGDSTLLSPTNHSRRSAAAGGSGAGTPLPAALSKLPQQQQHQRQQSLPRGSLSARTLMVATAVAD